MIFSSKHTTSSFVTLRKVLLKTHPTVNERMIQDFIADNPSVLELGDISLKDRERKQPRAGRLDMLFQDNEDKRRYEVEIQLGATDESHIIRTIEYWDMERKRYPQYEHCAVLIAEDVTSRFLNVMSLFNGSIPFVAIQLNAFQMADGTLALTFVTVLNELLRGLVEEDEVVYEKATRESWVEKSSKESIQLVDDVFALAKALYPNLELSYTKNYIGVIKDKRPFNFIGFKPKKQHIQLEFKLPYNEETNEKLNQAGFDINAYNTRFGYYPIILGKNSITLETYKDAITQFIQMAYERRVKE